MVEIIPYTSHYQPWFEKFNRAWIEKYFWMEPIDVDVLTRPEEHIVSHGGKILMALCNKIPVGTVALKKSSETVFEFTKMAVDEQHQGLKIGRALAEAALDIAKAAGATKVILYSHSSLKAALALYEKLGFIYVPVDGPYKRSDVKMEIQI